MEGEKRRNRRRKGKRVEKDEFFLIVPGLSGKESVVCKENVGSELYVCMYPCIHVSVVVEKVE